MFVKIIKMLELGGELKNCTVWLPIKSHNIGPNNPPVLLWWYKHPTPALAAVFREAVAAFQGSTRWLFEPTEHRWALMPARVREYADAKKLEYGIMDAAHILSEQEPDLGIQANAELPALLKHIQRHLKKKLPLRLGKVEKSA